MTARLRRPLALITISVALAFTTVRPTSLQAVSTTLVIHEFRTRGPNGGFDEFIEIRNVSGGGINLSGWNVIGSNGNGLQDVRANLPNVLLGAGSWLLGNSQPDGYTGPVDQTYAVGVTDDGGLALQAPGGGIVDSVGMSAGSAFGEGSRLSQLTTNTNRSWERVGADTDNNAANFALRNPSTPTTSGGGCTAPPPTATSPTLSGTSHPQIVSPGSALVLIVTVTPGTNPTSSGLAVVANLSSIGGAASAALFDDGTNGDNRPGDNGFFRNVTVGTAVTPGQKTIPVQVTDAQSRSGTGSIMIEVSAPASPPTATGTLSPNPVAPGALARIQVTAVPGTGPLTGTPSIVMNLSPLGRESENLFDAGGGTCDTTAGDLIYTACLLVPAATTPGPLALSGTVLDVAGSSAFVVNGVVSVPTDSDGDGLSDTCETTFGLNPNSGAEADGASGDPDFDGLTNAQECAAGTHPRGLFRRYLAEGATNTFFHTRVALFNPSTSPARTLVRLQPEGQAERAFPLTVPGQARRTLVAEDTLTLTGGGASFATVVESDVELAVDRTMTWGTGLFDPSGAGDYGSHIETAVHAPSTTWTLAEGATGWRFSLFYLLQNPSDQAADVEVNYLRGASDPVLTRIYTVPGRQRRTIWVDEEEFPPGSSTKPLASTDVSARINVTNGVPIIVERAMYMSPDDQAFGAGHGAAAVAAPATSWFFAEGSTGSFFDEFILLANGGATGANVTITFTPEGRSPVERTYRVAPNSRSTVWVDQIPGLEGTAVSATVTSSVPIVAERAMWWPGTGESWREAHVSAGATTTGPRWAAADLELGGPLDANSFVLIYGGGSATIYFDDGSAPVACGSSSGGRFTLHVNGCPGVGGKRFVSVIVDGNANTVVERATYYNARGEVFGAGGAALATRIP